MYRPKDTQERISHRLKISLGHLEKVIKMVQADEYCIDILHQLQALRQGVKSTEDLIMANHLESCVADEIKKGNSKTAISEVMSVLQKRNG